MKYIDLFKEENEQINERYLSAIERIKEIKDDNTVSKPYREYFINVAEFIEVISYVTNHVVKDDLADKTIDELAAYNKLLYNDILGENYDTSYCNPAYACEKLGFEYGQLLSFLYTEIRGSIVYSYEMRLSDITIVNELFLEIYNMFEFQTPRITDIKKAIYYFISDYSEITVEYRIRELLDPQLSFATDIIMNSDLSDLRYLYKYGEYIGFNEIEIAKYLNELSDAEISSMASTYTNGFKEGFISSGIDLSEKKTVNIRYSIGFERIVKSAILQFREMGLEPVIYRAATNRINKRQHIRNGYIATSPNKQYDYDHRFDDGIYWDKAICERKLVVLKAAYEKYKELANVYAGPAVIEVFGENPFEPVNSGCNAKYTDEQQNLSVSYSSKAGKILNEYIPRDKYSFTIISYPMPEIGNDFRDIFSETIKVNTLDNFLYKRIQQFIIDELDKAQYIEVIGKEPNTTNMRVIMHELNDPTKETNFENCLADVNIPVGEVFTSPKLKGTQGTLNVSEVYLNELKFKNLTIEFNDGMVSNYSCENFSDIADNKGFIMENLLMNRTTLPIGEFAIGTNTTAYVMAHKYNILYKLPTLIVEKMGPHFAVGDTCYSMSENIQLFNPDGKEIVAKENECSMLRDEDFDKAYFNCHTDITIPYEEILRITSVHSDGKKVNIISNGRFVLSGTEELNNPFTNN